VRKHAELGMKSGETIFFSSFHYLDPGLRPDPFIFGIRETRGQTGKSQDAGLSELRIRNFGKS